MNLDKYWQEQAYKFRPKSNSQSEAKRKFFIKKIAKRKKSGIFGISHGVAIHEIWQMPNMANPEPWEI